ncbi:MAG: hypothetical protein JWO19_4887 [Bryobacterales bacterium]|nr:hypothetical protein [Bryobacterales bacterium]
MQVQMDIAGSLELLEATTRQNLESAKALGLTAEQVRKIAKHQNRAPRVSRIRSASHAKQTQNSNTAIAPEMNEALKRLELRKRG